MTKELLVISKSKSLVKEIYSVVRKLPKEEKYIIIPQILRSAISVPSNIAEGQQRSDKEFLRFLRIARGSLSEVKVQLEIIEDNYQSIINKESFIRIQGLINEIGKMTYGLMLKLKAHT